MSQEAHSRRAAAEIHAAEAGGPRVERLPSDAMRRIEVIHEAAALERAFEADALNFDDRPEHRTL